jgi:hypothetical protein
MKVTELRYSRGATVNRGNFNNEKIEVAATVALDPGETEDEAFARLAKWVRAKVKEEIE